jgi:phosphoglycerate dehydrogenase-like enzyme
MEKINVAVTISLNGQRTEELKELTKGLCNLHFLQSAKEIVPIAEKVEIILGPAPADASLFAKAANLRWMQSGSAGVEDYIDIFKAHGRATITNASGAYGQGISEYLLAYALIILKKIPQYVFAQQRRDWHDYGLVKTIEGSAVTVVGLGNLGGTFARKIHLLGARVRGVKHFPAPKPDYIDELYTTEHIDEALAGADIVALCLPSTPKTRGIMSRERIFALKQDAILLNVGRGSAIDQAALCDALKEKRIYAGVDVTTPEPLPQADALWGYENLFLTPHISGGPSSVYAPEFISSLILRNMAAYLDGRPLENVVDLELGY